MPSAHNVAPLLALLAIWLVLSRLRRRNSALARRWIWILGLLAPLVVVTHMNFFRNQRALPRNGWDFYHYYVGPKYFRELGHVGLYEAQTVADYQDDREAYRPKVWVRVLGDYSYTHKALLVARREEIVSRFTPSRWQEFKADVAAFRHPASSKVPGWSQDHGYNGSPLTTTINKFVADYLPLSVPQFVRVVSWFDIGLVLGAAALIGRALGAQWGLTFLFFFGANPLNHFSSIGASFLRYLYLVAMALGITAFLRNKQATSGLLFAVATHLRLFPVLLPVAMFAADLLRPQRWELLRSRRRFYASFAASGVLLLGATSFVPAPEGQLVWTAFAKNSAMHADHDAVNQLGLRYLFRYSDDGNLAAIRGLDNRIWSARARETFARNAPWFYACAAVFLGLSIPYLRGIRRDEEAMFAGLVWGFALTQVAVYDYATLCLVPLLFRRDDFVWEVLGLTWIAICLINFLPGSAAALDWGYWAVNLVLAAYFAGMLALRAFRRRDRNAELQPGF